jgi:hypothetical protein
MGVIAKSVSQVRELSWGCRLGLATRNPLPEEVSGYWRACAAGWRRAGGGLLGADADLNGEPDCMHEPPLDTASGLGTRQESVNGWRTEKIGLVRRCRLTRRQPWRCQRNIAAIGDDTGSLSDFGCGAYSRVASPAASAPDDSRRRREAHVSE